MMMPMMRTKMPKVEGLLKGGLLLILRTLRWPKRRRMKMKMKGWEISPPEVRLAAQTHTWHVVLTPD